MSTPTFEFNFSSADINTEPETRKTLLEVAEDDILYHAHVNALISEATTAPGTANVWLEWHDDESFALNPDQPRRQLLQVPLGTPNVHIESRLTTYEFYFRMRNPGVMTAAVYDVYNFFSIDFTVDLIKLPVAAPSV